MSFFARGGTPRLLALLVILGAAPPLFAQWTQWGGPNRNFCVDAHDLAGRWADSGPKVVWSRELGSGHSSILADEDALYTLYRRGEQDVVVSLSRVDGQTKWEFAYDCPMKPNMMLEFGPGPHSTPLLAGNRLFTLSTTLLLHCLDKQTGKLLWKKDLVEEFGAVVPPRGFGASPIACKDSVIFSIGAKDAGVLALAQQDGAVRWKSEPLRQGYPSPILATIDGVEHLIFGLAGDRVGLDPETGATRWKFKVDEQSATIMSTPIFVAPDRLFSTAAYGAGSWVLRIRKQDAGFVADEVWHNNRMKIQHGNAIVIGDFVYGTSGDFGPALLMASDLRDGRVAWRERGFAKANLLYADGKLIILDETGTLTLATATPEKLTILAQAKVLEEKSWTVPTLVGSTLYLRDHHTIRALDLGAAANG